MSQKKSNVKDPSSLDSKKKVIEEKTENPSWYHYLVILGGFALIFVVISMIINVYNSSQEIEIVDVLETDETYSYTHKVGNVSYTILLVEPLENLRKLNYVVEPNLLDILNTLSFKFSFGEYNGTDNGQVSLAATKLRKYLSLVHFITFEQEDFLSNITPSCDGSTKTNRIVTFEINSSISVSGVFEEENGCIRVISSNAIEFPYIMDYFIVSILQEK